jgi:sialate O-acetylesterase
MFRIIVLTLFLASIGSANANVILPEIFGDHMVLQQKSRVTIWGWAKAGENVKVIPGWDSGRDYSVTVDTRSTWSIEIETPAAGGPYEITVQGYNTIKITDVLIGEVWLGSGQSNMEMTTAGKIDNGDEERAKANYPSIRFFTVQQWAAATPQHQLKGKWEVCTPESMNDFSAAMYFFGREVHQKMNIPVGLICSAWGGTPVEIWMSEGVVNGDKMIRESAALLKPVPWGPVEPGRTFNTMIYPLAPFRIAGALWYQGEANVINANQYARSLAALIASWRSLWGYDFPFYFAQIAPWAGYGTDNVSGAILRDQQRQVLNLMPKTGMIVLSDIGDLQDIHPKNKRDVGKRFAAWALNKDYGYKDISFSGPLFKSWEVRKEKAIIHFDHTDGGLVARDGELREFEVLDASGKWNSVAAKVNGAVVEIDLKTVKEIKGVRFGYRNDSNPNLFNKAGFPASCFEAH